MGNKQNPNITKKCYVVEGEPNVVFKAFRRTSVEAVIVEARTLKIKAKIEKLQEEIKDVRKLVEVRELSIDELTELGSYELVDMTKAAATEAEQIEAEQIEAGLGDKPTEEEAQLDADEGAGQAEEQAAAQAEQPTDF